MGKTVATAMEFEKTPLRVPTIKPKKETKKMSSKKKTPEAAPVAKEPRTIKLSTIWKGAVYSFAVIGVVLSVMYVNDIVSNVVESRAEARAQEILKAQPVAAPQSKVNQ